MLIFGIFLFIIGLMLLLYGNSINNDMDMQMESLFNDGITNPGDTFVYLGVALIFVGVILFIVGIIRNSDKHQYSMVEGKTNDTVKKQQEIYQQHKTYYENYSKIKCHNCGRILQDESNFCGNCGYKVNGPERTCKNCGNVINENDKFCSNCGNRS